MTIAGRSCFVYHESMNVEDPDTAAARVAATIGEPARARILFCLTDGRARTSTELAVVAGVSPSTASVHLQRLRAEGLVGVHAQGKHRYYHLGGPHVARVLEALAVIAGRPRGDFVPRTPAPLRAARTCYDHMAGGLAVMLHDRLHALRWILRARGQATAYELTPAGVQGFAALGVDVAAARALRRRFAVACLDWSERRPHLGGALGAALLRTALERKWVTRELDSRILSVTPHGRRELRTRLQVEP